MLVIVEIVVLNIKTKLKQKNFQNTEQKLFYCTHCHKYVCNDLISLFY